MRVAVITEFFLPQINGVTNSVLRVCEQLTRRGHEVLVVAPGSGPQEWKGIPVVRTPLLPLPGYRDFRVARHFRGMRATLRDFAPDVVHLASPLVLGAKGAMAARQLGMPYVAVYQTDIAGFAKRYGLGLAQNAAWRRLRKVHGAAARTLAPSTHAVRQLQENGFERVVRWARGIDLVRFHAARRDAGLRAELAPRGELLVGYIGRLAYEKQVGRLADAQHLPGIRLVVVGDGPQRKQLERQLPRAAFLGFRTGASLASTFASLDLFVHAGAHETFCQAAQEALASSVPVVAARAGGLLDLVQHGMNGLTFEPGSARALAGCVEQLRDDPRARSEMRGAARRSVEGRSWDVIGEELTQHYREVA